jgi:hypothetical protein
MLVFDEAMSVSEPIDHPPAVFMKGSFGSRLCENSRVQFARRKFFSIWSILKPKMLATAI